MKDIIADDRLINQLLKLAMALFVGAVAGLAIFLLAYRQMGQAPDAEDVAYSLGGGVACLAMCIVTYLAFHPMGIVARLRPLLIALLLGTGLALSTLAIFWWLQRRVFIYEQYPDLNYLLGEVGGYSAPGLGLFVCGVVLVWTYFLQPGSDSRLRSGMNLGPSLPAVLQRQRQMLELLSRLALASVLGAGAGLLGGAMTYIILGVVRGPTSELAGYLAAGLGCLAAGIAFLLLCARNGLPWFWGVGVALFVITGVVLCSMGVIEWQQTQLLLLRLLRERLR